MPLASTTYYFRSVNELVEEALKLHVAERVADLEGLIEVASSVTGASVTQFAARMAEVLVAAEGPTLVAQYQMYLEAGRNPALQPAVSEALAAFEELIARVLAALGARDPPPRPRPSTPSSTASPSTASPGPATPSGTPPPSSPPCGPCSWTRSWTSPLARNCTSACGVPSDRARTRIGRVDQRTDGAVPASLYHEEAARLAVLREYGVLDTLPEASFDDIVFLASYICEAPVAMVSLVDEDRQWFKAKVGTDLEETPRDAAFCAHAILEPNEIFVVPTPTRTHVSPPTRS